MHLVIQNSYFNITDVHSAYHVPCTVSYITFQSVKPYVCKQGKVPKVLSIASN